MNDTIRTLLNLKTTRSNNFSDQEIDSEILDSILKSSFKAPNASNRQSYSVIILDKEQQKLLKLDGDKILLYLVDFNRLQLLSEQLTANISFDHFQAFLSGVIDVSLAVQNAVVAASSFDIGYLVTNDTYTKDPEKLYSIFNLPEKLCFPLLFLCLGYPKDKFVKNKSRINSKYIIHNGTYKNYNEKDILDLIQEYDSPSLQLFNGWKEKNFTHYLEWFFNKWTPTLESKEKSENLAKIITDKGFLSFPD